MDDVDLFTILIAILSVENTHNKENTYSDDMDMYSQFF